MEELAHHVPAQEEGGAGVEEGRHHGEGHILHKNISLELEYFNKIHISFSYWNICLYTQVIENLRRWMVGLV